MTRNKYAYYLAITWLSFTSTCLAMPADIREATPNTRVLQRLDVPGTTYQEGMGVTEFMPHAVKSQQVQSEPEICYVLEGEIDYFAQGKPKRTIKAGESYTIPAGEIHYSVAGSKGAKVLTTWVLEKGKSFAMSIH